MITDPVVILQNMKTIAENEMLVRGYYVDPHAFDEDKAREGAICGGHKFCAIGSVWAGAGFKAIKHRFGGFQLAGAPSYQREDFLSDKPALSAALDALNVEAQKVIDEADLQRPTDWGDDDLDDREDAIELLFESPDIDPTTPEDRALFISVIDAAIARVSA